ncbi:L,D-transpeptidase family protein [Fundidesulfovibrio magnetotacticus]|uniref:L,D-transpeptidase family protein n=1 Tax=Fundidesulfovibrio magnetotacticus TaxID=2730080 RepID=UPI0015659FAC|nr:L,D-transpeptidase family protein [Fundidesulfovibrio magnetotacticus]
MAAPHDASSAKARRRARTSFLLAALATLSLLLAGQARAGEGWAVNLKADAYGPQRFLAVDKSSQTFWIFEQKSPLSPVKQLPCTTGQEPGTKWKEGDLKTPEGVYFIKQRINGGLDFSLYGDLAFTLNYPNPIDVINGRKGSGIWIHGRGKPITPNESRGCVALNNPDIKELDPQLTKRVLPVVIANEVHWSKDDPVVSKEGQEVVAATLEWAKAWSRKSEAFFAFHDAQKFSVSTGEPFENFRGHKRQLFAKLPWIHVLIDDVRAVQGPDYWVTYFGQLYRSPTLSSEGIKRLYWQRNAEGRMVIVGMDYDETTLGLETKYVERVRPEVLKVVEAWRQAWEKGKVADYVQFYADNATQGDRKGRAAIRDHKQQLWTGAKAPKKVAARDMKFSLAQDGVLVEFVQEYASRDGVADKGRKKLVLGPSGDGWLIMDEDWSKL